MKWLFCLLIPFLASAVSLKDRVLKAKSGDYCVIEAGKMATLIAVRPSPSHSFVIEEISVPMESLPKTLGPGFWAEWVLKRAPGHTSWIMVEMDTKQFRPIECYSFTKSAWIQLQPQESLFSTLFQLPLSSIPEEKRRKIGPPPFKEMDTRKVWEPPVFQEGKKKRSPTEAFAATWPDDGSELSCKALTLYFSRESPFPIWVEVETTAATAQIKTVDTGRNLFSPHRSFPRRIPQFVGAPKRLKEGLVLNLKSPAYYHEFELYAVDLSGPKRELCPIHFSKSRKEEWLIFHIEEEELQNCLKKDHRYNWLCVPVGYSESYTESTKYFTWR